VLVRGYVHEVVIACAARSPVIPAPTSARTSSSTPLHYLALLERKIGALDQAAPLVGWELPAAEFVTLRRLLEARMGKPGKREFVQILSLGVPNPTFCGRGGSALSKVTFFLGGGRSRYLS
jgi:hypothetical protein